MSVEINMLPVGKADCIHVRFSDKEGYHNIVIDSGGANAEIKFKRLLLKIDDRGESVDLLCFTHVDNDHIMGASKLFARSDNSDWSFIKKVWLNIDGIIKSGKQIKPGYQFAQLTAEKACSLYDSLVSKGLNVETGIVEGHSFSAGEASITVLTPSEIKHEKNQRVITEKLKFPQLSSGPDTSPENADSIAFVLSVHEEAYLFTGDAHAVDIIEGLKKYYPQTHLSCVKLPHHGSERNLSLALLEQMKTNIFLISSNGSVNFPSEETIDLLESYKHDRIKYLLCNFELNIGINNPKKLKNYNLTSEKFNKKNLKVFSEVYYG